MGSEVYPTAEYYLGWYQSDDGKSRKDCNALLLFGELANEVQYKFDWKHVQLPCPVCEFTHNFKRSEWSEGIKLESMGDYAKRDV